MDRKARAREIIDDCGLFRAVTPEKREVLVGLARLDTAPKGHVFLRDGDDCPGVFVVGRGLVRVFKIAPSGKEHTLHLPGPGDTFAEAAVIGRFPCPASAEALEETEYLVLPARELTTRLEADHALCLQLLEGLSGWVRHLVHLMEDIVLRDALGRLARYLLAQGREGERPVSLPMRHRYLASHLNLAPETLSRCLRRLTDAGLLATEADGRIRIVDAEALGSVAEGLYPPL